MLNNYEYGLFIPVHRKIQKKVLESALQEIRIAKNRFRLEIPLIVIDDSHDRDVSRYNRDIVCSMKSDQTPVIFIPRSFIENLACDISAKLGLKKELLISNNTAYGKVFNMIYLTGRIWDLKFYHRRDSDVYLQEYRGDWLAPVEIELAHIGKVIQGNLIHVAGSNYAKESNVRFDERMKNPQFLKFFFLSLGMSNDDEVLRKMADTYLDHKAYDGDRISIVTGCTLDSSDYVDCGNVCFSSFIYEMIPNSPNDYFIGTDYQIFFMVEALRLGQVIHNRTLVHDYHSQSMDRTYLTNYWTEMYYHLDMHHVLYKAYNEIENLYRDRNVESTEFEKIRAQFTELIRNAFAQTTSAKRIPTLKHLSQGLKSLGVQDYSDITTQIEADNFEKVFTMNARLADEYIFLIESWNDILGYMEENREHYRKLLDL